MTQHINATQRVFDQFEGCGHMVIGWTITQRRAMEFMGEPMLRLTEAAFEWGRQKFIMP